MDPKLEQLFYFALGSALTVKERLEKNSEEFKAWQEKAEDQARSFVDDVTRRGEEEKNAFRQILTDALKEVVAELNLATRDDLDELKAKLDN